MSMDMPSQVLAQTIASAPSASTACATAAGSAACGVIFTHRGPRHIFRAARTASAVASVPFFTASTDVAPWPMSTTPRRPQAMPSPSTFGQEIFSSAAAMPSISSSTLSVSCV